MVSEAFLNSWVFSWCVVPLLIFVARIMDVSIGTLRVIFVAKGYRIYAPILGFFEVIIWLLAIRQILNHINNPMCYLAYGLGFGVGNYVGIRLDERLSWHSAGAHRAEARHHQPDRASTRIRLRRVAGRYRGHVRQVEDDPHRHQTQGFERDDADHPVAQPERVCHGRGC